MHYAVHSVISNCMSYNSYHIIITTVNTKGGVGKTTSAVYLVLAAYNSNLDSPILLMDLDLQRSATVWVNIAADGGW